MAIIGLKMSVRLNALMQIATLSHQGFIMADFSCLLKQNERES